MIHLEKLYFIDQASYCRIARRIPNLTNRQDAKNAKKIKKKIGNLVPGRE